MEHLLAAVSKKKKTVKKRKMEHEISGSAQSPFPFSSRGRGKLNRTPYITGAHAHARSRTCTRTWGKWLTRERSGEQCCTIHASTRLVLFRGSHWITLSIKVILPPSLPRPLRPSLSIFPWALFLYTAFSDRRVFFYNVPLEPTMTGFVAFPALSSSAAPVTAAAPFNPIDDHRFSAFTSSADVDPYWDSATFRLSLPILFFFKFLHVLCRLYIVLSILIHTLRHSRNNFACNIASRSCKNQPSQNSSHF